MATSYNEGQQYESNQVHYLYTDVDVADDGVFTDKTVGVLPEGATIVAVTATVTAAFNGTNPVVTFTVTPREGTTRTLDSGALGAVGHKETSLASAPDLTSDEPRIVTAALAGSGNRTAGVARLSVSYLADNNNPG